MPSVLLMWSVKAVVREDILEEIVVHEGSRGNGRAAETFHLLYEKL